MLSYRRSGNLHAPRRRARRCRPARRRRKRSPPSAASATDGKKYYGKTVPPQCYGRLVEQLNEPGHGGEAHRPRRQPTSDAKARKPKRRSSKKRDAATRETTRRDRALLATYTSEKDIEEQRGRALADNQKAVREIEAARDRAEEAARELRQGARVLPGQEGRARPSCRPSCRRRSARPTSTSRRSRNSLEAKKKEVDHHQRASYDDDKKRYIELTKRSAPPAACGAGSRSPAAGWPCPCVAFIAWPTSALNAFSLPARYSSTSFAFAASTSSTSFSIAPASEICLRPRCLDDRVGRPALPPAHIASNTSFADLAGDRAVGDARRAARASRCGRHRRLADVEAARRSARAADVAHHPVGRRLCCALADSATAASK